MCNVEFGKLLKRLRKEKFSEDGGPWTQDYLAEKANLSPRTIGDIERGQKAHLDEETLNCLANALELSYTQREEFFAAAGLIFEALPFASDLDQLESVINNFYKSVRLPAYVSDDLFDFHSFNSYFAEVFEINLAAKRCEAYSSRLNILHILFDPVFNAKAQYGGEEKWLQYAKINVQIFRNLSLRYHTSQRYRELIHELYKLPRFRLFWELTADDEGLDPLVEGSRMRALHHSKHGEMTFWVADSSVLTAAMGLTISIYTPANDETEHRFTQLRDETPFWVLKFDKC